MHLYVHQMWLEGAFNVLDYNQHNCGEDLMESNLLNKYNNFNQQQVPSEEIDKHAREIKKQKTDSNNDVGARREIMVEAFTEKSKQERKKKSKWTQQW